MRLLPLAVVLLLAACQLTLPGSKPPPAGNPITGDAITVSPLALPPDPQPRPAALGETAPTPVAAAAVPAPKSAEQITCEKNRGTWARAGKTGAMLCLRPTRDSGKQCRKGTDCEGMCLARSGTCAPITPMFGCTEILQDDGQRVTLCID